ncbi:hypothetical protein ELQ90_12080 [Labedella phragmitis]|uniref:Uncharacterized protein n=1 Tax=Labedella phragmitis TaxID=2498849 RepID=A0A3S4DJN1_9MICO|nr:hypothetical protein [Labedella phragmitis]RWZ50074.1 hypothetical protein ELQ90_12080 [Labedella phragmitis]
MVADDVPSRIAVHREQSRSWVEVAQSARVMRDLLTETPSAIDGSPFKVIDQDLPQSCEVWCRSYLSSALEHLGMWADFVAPLTFHPDGLCATRHVQLRRWPARRSSPRLKRYGSWPREIHVKCFGGISRSVLADWAEQRKAEVDPERKAGLK